MALHTDIQYPVIGGTISRLRDIRVVVHNTSLPPETAPIPETATLSIGTESGVVYLYVDGVRDAELYTPASTIAATLSINATGTTVSLVVDGPPVAADDQAPLPLEPCTVIWLSDSVQDAFITALETSSGLLVSVDEAGTLVEAKIGSGISMDGTADRVFSGDPTPVEYEAPTGLLMLNGHSTRAVPLEVSRSVDTELEVDSLSNPEDLDEDPVEHTVLLIKRGGLNE